DEAGEVVHVAVGVVAEDAFAEPDHVRRSEMRSKDFFVVLARHAGIALLHFAEQAFFGGEERAAAVDVDRAAFEHHASVAVKWTDFLDCGSVRHEAADFFVVPPVGIFRPGVKARVFFSPLTARLKSCLSRSSREWANPNSWSVTKTHPESRIHPRLVGQR